MKKIIGETFAYSQRWNVIETDDQRLRDQFIGKTINYTYNLDNALERSCKVINVGYLEYSDYVYLICEHDEQEQKEHKKRAEALFNETGIDARSPLKSFAFNWEYRKNLYKQVELLEA